MSSLKVLRESVHGAATKPWILKCTHTKTELELERFLFIGKPILLRI
jgi:hypothetical protein